MERGNVRRTWMKIKYRLVKRIQHNRLRKPRFRNVVGVIKSNLIQSLYRVHNLWNDGYTIRKYWFSSVLICSGTYMYWCTSTSFFPLSSFKEKCCRSFKIDIAFMENLIRSSHVSMYFFVNLNDSRTKKNFFFKSILNTIRISTIILYLLYYTIIFIHYAYYQIINIET